MFLEKGPLFYLNRLQKFEILKYYFVFFGRGLPLKTLVVGSRGLFFKESYLF